LKERFEEKNDPLHGSVMRCINDKTAHLFMEVRVRVRVRVRATVSVVDAKKREIEILTLTL
jgi:hypothetical protein